MYTQEDVQSSSFVEVSLILVYRVYVCINWDEASWLADAVGAY